jgi:hypothetical protein
MIIRIVELTGFITRKQHTATAKALKALWPELTVTVRSRTVRKRRQSKSVKRVL